MVQHDLLGLHQDDARAATERKVTELLPFGNYVANANTQPDASDHGRTNYDKLDDAERGRRDGYADLRATLRFACLRMNGRLTP